MRKLLSLSTLVALPLMACADGTGITDADADAGLNLSLSHGDVRVYEVTLENLTTGQPFSPGVIATHRKRRHAFEVGDPASEGIRLIAEDGDPSVAVADLSGTRGFHDVQATPAPVGCIGCGGPPFPTSLTLQITARGNANRLSLAVMLICTNDGFTGLDGVKLPGGFKPKTFYAAGYDAGTEANDELYTSIVDPCGGIGPVAVAPDGANDRTPTSGVITHHPGIQGVGDLDPSLYGWEDPVLRVTVKRLQVIDDEEVETEADLDGSQEVPSVATNMTGEVEVEIEDGELEFELEVSSNTNDIFAAHIHCAPPGVNGPVGVTLFTGSFTAASGTVAEGTITAPDAGNGCGWADLSAVAAAIQSGNTYVNVHTTAASGGVPSGEIRGNLPGNDDDDD